MITSIKREFDLFPNIVGIVTTDDLTTITTTDYFSTQLAQVELLNNGVWQWETEDIVLIFYATDLIGWFTYDATTDAFVSLAANGGLSNTLPSADIFVGNGANVATGVPVTGILRMTNTGATSIPLASGDILVGNGGGTAAPVAMTGDIGISNAGVTAIQPGVIVNSEINASAAIDFSKLAALTSGHILVGSAGNVPTSVAMSGDATISNTGALTIGAGAVTGSKIANNAVDYAQLALDVAATATVTLTAAQIKSLYDTPVQLIAAPGSGKLILIDSILWDIAFVSAQYTAGGAIQAQYGNTAHGAGSPASASIAAATLNGVAASGFIANGSGAATLNAPATVENTAVFLSNATQDFATGDSTVTLYVRYRVVTPA